MMTRTWAIAREFGRAGDAEFAARLVEQSGAGSGAVRAFGVDEAFQYIAKARGEAAAAVWLEPHYLDPASREMLEGLLLTQGYAAAAYRMAMADTAAGSGSYPALVAAAAWRLDGSARADWGARVRHRLASLPDDRYTHLARFLLGDRSEADVLALATDDKSRTEVWFYCGLKSWSEGRASEALAWMELTQEVGSSRDGEWYWAGQLLGGWAAAWKAPERLTIARRERA